MEDLKKGLVSIIIPVYNAEQYIGRCLESLINQTYRDMEIVVVDDGSNDSSWEIISDYAEKDLRIKAYHKKNGGVSSARNFGLHEISGEYLMFVDSDDFAMEDMCEKLINYMEDDTELIIGSYKVLEKNGESEKAVSNYYKFYVDEIGKYISELMELWVINSLWGKLYRNRNDGLQFDESCSIGEDFIYNLSYIDKIKGNVVCVPDIVYGYNRINECAATKRFRRNDLEQEIKLNNSIKKFLLGRLDIEKLDYIINRRLYVNGMDFLLKVFSSNIKLEEKKEILKETFSYSEYVNSCKIKYRKSIKEDIYRFLCKSNSLNLIVLYFTAYVYLRNILKINS